jgi:multidrug efflux pump subunit AcrA (membrane-fusion protein)
VNGTQQKRVKLLSAVIGASAVVAMGALGVIFGDVSSAAPEQVAGPVAPQATEQTVTTTTPPPVPETSVATPSVTATTPSGFAPAPHP